MRDRVLSNLSFTAKFKTREAPEFIEEFQGLRGFRRIKKVPWDGPWDRYGTGPIF